MAQSLSRFTASCLLLPVVAQTEQRACGPEVRVRKQETQLSENSGLSCHLQILNHYCGTFYVLTIEAFPRTETIQKEKDHNALGLKGT